MFFKFPNCFLIVSLAWIFPVTLTKTVSVGESTTLNVTTTIDESLLRWRKDSYPLNDTDGLSSLSFENITLADAGIYECHSSEARNGSSAFMKLIVRGKLNKQTDRNKKINEYIYININIKNKYWSRDFTSHLHFLGTDEKQNKDIVNFFRGPLQT